MTAEFQPRRENLLKTLCAIAIVAIVAGALWPFNPLPANGVSWVPGASAVRFSRPGLVLSKAPLRLAADSGTSCSLELLVRPASTKSSYTILNFYTPEAPKQLLVRQWTDGLLVTSESVNAQNQIISRKFDVNHAFQPDKLTLVTITSGAKGTVVYLNGGQAQAFPKFLITQNELAGQIVLGTSAVDYQPWPGEVYGLAVYAGELSATEVSWHYRSWTAGDRVDAPIGVIAWYTFREGRGSEIRNAVASGPSLEIPRYFTVPHKAMLTSPVQEFEPTRKYAMDLLVNIGGFVPLGLILCVYLSFRHAPRHAILYATITGVLLSLLIEILQAYIPQRVSGITDVITNSLGTGLGALLGQTALVRTILRKTDAGR